MMYKVANFYYFVAVSVYTEIVHVFLCFGLMLFRLLQLQRSVLSPDSDVPDELLYGRAGYLYALLYVNKEIGPDTVDDDTIAKVHVVLFTINICDPGVLSRWGIFAVIDNNTLYGSKLYIFLL